MNTVVQLEPEVGARIAALYNTYIVAIKMMSIAMEEKDRKKFNEWAENQRDAALELKEMGIPVVGDTWTR